MAWSTEKLPGFCRGGNSWKDWMCCATIACAGTKTKRCSMNHLSLIAGLLFRTLERVGTQIEQLGRAQLNQWLHPNLQAVRLLLQEHRLVLVVAEPGEVAIVGPVEELAALVGPLAGEEVALVVAVEVHLEALAICAVALQELLLDVGRARRRRQGRHPVLRRDDVVDLAVRRHHRRPTHDRRHAIAALPI